MKVLFTILFLCVSTLGYGQSVGSKVSFEAADGKRYTGKITQIEDDKYKIRYEGFEFESWMLKTQFAVIEEMADQPATAAPAPALPHIQGQPLAEQAQPQPVNMEQASQNTPLTTGPMTPADSLKMAINDMKNAFNAASKLFAGKSDTLTIVITDIDYENVILTRLKESLGKLKGTRSVVMQYGGSTARLAVAFKGKAGELWDSVPIDIRTMFKLVEAGEKKIMLRAK